jgi:hypothetical protein
VTFRVPIDRRLLHSRRGRPDQRVSAAHHRWKRDGSQSGRDSPL